MTVLLNKRQVAERLGCHPATVMRLVDSGDLPAPIRLTPRTQQGNLRWDEADISRWVEERKSEAARDARPEDITA